MSKNTVVTIAKKTSLTHNIREIELVPESPFDFIAGQFGLFIFPSNEGTVTRAYSFASPPGWRNRLQICFKLQPEGVSTQFFEQAPIGTTLKMTGPYGRFNLGASGEPVTLVATGSGFAPYRSILSDALLDKASTRSINFLFGVRNENDIFWQEFLEELKIKFKNFSYTITLTQPGSAWDGTRGRVTEHLGAHLQAGIKTFYLCGSPAMVKDARELLLGAGIAPENVHFEIFV